MRAFFTVYVVAIALCVNIGVYYSFGLAIITFLTIVLIVSLIMFSVEYADVTRSTRRYRDF